MSKIKRILIVAGSLAAIIAILFGVIKWTSNDKKTVSSLKFKIGDLSAATGEHLESSKAIYTEELIECEGLSIVPDFESKSTYRVFWYNLDGEFISATTETTKYTEEFSKEPPLAAEYCRIVIYPHPTDENGKTLRNIDIKFYQVRKYAKQLTIKVDKKQHEPIDFYASAIIWRGKIDGSGKLLDAVLSNDSLFVEGASIDCDSLSEYWSHLAVEDEECDLLFLDISKCNFLKVSNSGEACEIDYFFIGKDGRVVAYTEGFISQSTSVSTAGSSIINVGVTSAAYVALILHSSPDISVYFYK